MVIKGKRILLFLMLTTLVFATLSQCNNGREQTYRKHFDDVSDLVNLNNDDLTQIVKDIHNNTVSEEEAEKELTACGVDAKVELQENGNIEFVCVGEGFASNSRYYGFFYSIDNDIRRISWYNDDYKSFSEFEQGFYTDDGTDNYIYIEQIRQHWYYYCAGF